MRELFFTRIKLVARVWRVRVRSHASNGEDCKGWEELPLPDGEGYFGGNL